MRRGRNANRGIGVAVLFAAFALSGCSGATNETGGAGGSATGGAPSVTSGAGGSTNGGVLEQVVGAATAGSSGIGGNVGGNGSLSDGGGDTLQGGAPAAGSRQTGSAGAEVDPVPANVLVTSTKGNYWKIGAATETTSDEPNVVIDPTAIAQTWDGFGGGFTEIGWSLLTSKELQDLAVQLLFSASDGANFAWGLIPIGASDYALSRYTLDDTGPDVTPNSDGSNRPAPDLTLSQFSLERDGQRLIPYVKAAQAVKPALRFWATPLTPPVWMKSGYMTTSNADPGRAAEKPSFYDGGVMSRDPASLDAYARYFAKFVQGYRAQGISVEIVAPQSEPTFEQNAPSCLWGAATYAEFVAAYLGPAMKALDVTIMLGLMTSGTTGGDSDLGIAIATLADPAAKGFLSVAGAAWRSTW